MWEGPTICDTIPGQVVLGDTGSSLDKPRGASLSAASLSVPVSKVSLGGLHDPGCVSQTKSSPSKLLLVTVLITAIET